MAKRIITEQEELVFRLYHADFEGLSTKKIAKRLNLSQRRIQQILSNLRDKAPQLFIKNNNSYHRPKLLRYESWMDKDVIKSF